MAKPGEDLSSCGADVAFEFAGNDDGVRIAMESVRPGGRVVRRLTNRTLYPRRIAPRSDE